MLKEIRGEVGPFENYAKNIFSKFGISEKTLGKIWTIVKYLFVTITIVF